jgi:hypothetical protein
VTMDGFKNAPAVPRRLYADFCNKIWHETDMVRCLT